MLQDEARRYAKVLNRQVPDRPRQFAPVNVPALREASLMKLQRGEDEQIRAFVKSRFTDTDLIPDAFPKSQLGHC
jgi:hypothetical protein